MFHINEENLIKIIDSHIEKYETSMKFSCFKAIENYLELKQGSFYNEETDSYQWKDINSYLDINEEELLERIKKNLIALPLSRSQLPAPRAVKEAFGDLNYLTSVKNSYVFNADETIENLKKSFLKLCSKSNLDRFNPNDKNNLEIINELYEPLKVNSLNKTENLLIIENGENTVFIDKYLLSECKNRIENLNHTVLNKSTIDISNKVFDILRSDSLFSKFIVDSLNAFDHTFKGKIKNVMGEFKTVLEKKSIFENVNSYDTECNLPRRKRL